MVLESLCVRYHLRFRRLVEHLWWNIVLPYFVLGAMILGEILTKVKALILRLIRRTIIVLMARLVISGDP